MEFQVGDKVMLKVLSWKGVVTFCTRGKLTLGFFYVGPFKVLEKVGEVAYKLELPEELSRVHNTFHVSNLKKCYADEPLAVPLDGLHFDDKLQFVEEPVEIMDSEVKRLKQSRIPLVKISFLENLLHVNMDDPNISMEEYIRLEEEKARRRGKVYNWETATHAIVYNDTLTSKSDFLTEPTISPQHIDEFDLKNETSLFEYDEVEQNVLYFNDLFPFNVIYPDDSKSDEDNDDDKIDIKQSSGVIKEYLVKVNKRRAFWSLNKDILKINDSNYQYVVSIKEDTAYSCLYSPKTTKETRSIRISKEDQYAVLEIWNEKILEEIKRGPYSKEPPIRCIQAIGYTISNQLQTL
ncbi:hypothetical protein Tco_1474763 [Tanacetum coccineum]